MALYLIFINKRKQNIWKQKHWALMKYTRVPKAHILSQNFKIRGDLGLRLLHWLSLMLSIIEKLVKHGFQLWEVFMSLEICKTRTQDDSWTPVWKLLPNPPTFTWRTWAPEGFSGLRKVTQLGNGSQVENRCSPPLGYELFPPWHLPT